MAHGVVLAGLDEGVVGVGGLGDGVSGEVFEYVGFYGTGGGGGHV